MEFILLCVSAVIMAKYAEKRSSILFTVAHALLFVVLLFSMFFTTDFVPLQYVMRQYCGGETYEAVRAALYTPCMWAWSANLVLCFVKVFLLIFLLLWATFYVVKRFVKSGRPFDRKPANKPVIYTSPVVFFATGNLLFLKLCRLLD